MDEEHAGEKACDMGPDGDAADIFSARFGEDCGSGEELQNEPVSEHEPGGKVKEKNGREPDEHARLGIKDDVGAEDTGNSSAGPDHADHGVGIDGDLAEIGADSGEQIKDEIREVAEVVFDVIPENVKEEHVAEDVHPSFMKEHGGEEGNDDLRKTCVGSPDVGGHESEDVEERAEFRTAKREFVEKDEDVQGDQEGVDEGKTVTGLIVFEGNHVGFGKLVADRFPESATARANPTSSRPAVPLPNYQIS